MNTKSIENPIAKRRGLRIRQDFAMLSRWRRNTFIVSLGVILALLLVLNPLLNGGLKNFWNLFWNAPSYSLASGNFNKVFDQFRAMSCGIQGTEVALMSGDDGNLIHDALFMDKIAGKIMGQYQVVVPFTPGQGFSYTVDESKRHIDVVVEKFMIVQPSVVGFEDEYHAEGLFSKLSSKEPVIDRVIQLGRQVIAENASQDYQNPSWFNDCSQSIKAQWRLIGQIFGYEVTVDVHSPDKPLPIEWGPIKVSTVADILDS